MKCEGKVLKIKYFLISILLPDCNWKHWILKPDFVGGLTFAMSFFSET